MDRQTAGEARARPGSCRQLILPAFKPEREGGEENKEERRGGRENRRRRGPALPVSLPPAGRHQERASPCSSVPFCEATVNGEALKRGRGGMNWGRVRIFHDGGCIQCLVTDKTDKLVLYF